MDKKNLFNSILVVCTGNICRSPLAEAFLGRALAASGIKVSSAGIAALVGHPADAMAQEVALEHGLDLASHRARQLTRELLVTNEIVMVLDETHERWITQRFPELRGKTFRLGRWIGNRAIADPYRLPKVAFEKAMTEIEESATSWLLRLRNGS